MLGLGFCCWRCGEVSFLRAVAPVFVVCWDWEYGIGIFGPWCGCAIECLWMVVGGDCQLVLARSRLYIHIHTQSNPATRLDRHGRQLGSEPSSHSPTHPSIHKADTNYQPNPPVLIATGVSSGRPSRTSPTAKMWSTLVRSSSSTTNLPLCVCDLVVVAIG